MKPLVIYHANCADGFGAAFAAWLKLGDEAEYVPMSYGEDWTIDPRGREVYILDFSFPKDIMTMIFAGAKCVVWLDHHKSVFDDLGYTLDKAVTEEDVFGHEYEPHFILLNNNKSGAILAWEYFHPDTEVPMLIKHIDDYDRWQFKLKGTKEINKALWSFTPWTFPLWQEIIDDDQYGSMWSQGSAILRAHNQNVQSVVKGSARKVFINLPNEPGFEPKGLDLYGLTANCPPHLTSDVGHELATQSGTFGLCWTLGQSGTVAKCSLRSNGEYDVSAIAKSFGGGGHRNAAGFQVDIQVLLGWLK